MNYALSFTHNNADEYLFKQNDLVILPFYGIDGKPNLSDSHLAQIFRRLVYEDTLNKVFYDGTIKKTNDFISFVKNINHEIFFVQFNDEEAGFFWLTKFNQKSSFITYGFYKSFFGKKALIISKLCIEHILNKKDPFGEYIIDVLLGITPANNTLAIKFLVKNGMTILGKIPKIIYNFTDHKPVDGILSYKVRSSDKGKTVRSIYSLLF